MDWTAASYVGYLVVAVPLTVWVATVLSRNGAVFLTDVFDDNRELATAVNRLLVVGFYLLNLGFVMLYLRSGGTVVGLSGMLEELSTKVGIVMLVTGAVHFVNVYAFNSIRRRSRQDAYRAQHPAVNQHRPYPVAGYPAPGQPPQQAQPQAQPPVQPQAPRTR